MNDIEQQELKKENESLKEEIRLLKKKTELLSITQPLNKLSQFLIDRMDAIIFIKDVANDFRYFMVNQNFCILQNTPHHKIIGKNDYEIQGKRTNQKPSTKSFQRCLFFSSS